jgi:thiamine-monophosphate kinase
MLEQALIRLIRQMGTGIGDDCAVWQPTPGWETIVTTDQLVEGVHYLKDRMTAEVAGARLLGRGLSDIAAMGGEARLVFLNVAWPGALPKTWQVGFLRGFGAEARKWKVAWAGGDISSAGGTPVASITAIGEVPKGDAILRSGATPGDIVYVSGKLGAARKRITPRLALGRKLRGIATAGMDISDGLSTDLHHLAEESHVGAAIEASRIPCAGSLERALNYGEDYELLFTARASRKIPARIAGVKITAIGRITRGSKVMLDGQPLAVQGWEHFGREHLR